MRQNIYKEGLPVSTDTLVTELVILVHPKFYQYKIYLIKISWK